MGFISKVQVIQRGGEESPILFYLSGPVSAGSGD